MCGKLYKKLHKIHIEVWRVCNSTRYSVDDDLVALNDLDDQWKLEKIA